MKSNSYHAIISILLQSLNIYYAIIFYCKDDIKLTKQLILLIKNLPIVLQYKIQMNNISHIHTLILNPY